MKRSFARVAAAFLAVCAIVPAFAAAPSYVDITWFSISNLYLQVGPLGIIVDGYITRIPASAFFGGGGGLAGTHQAYTPDVAGVTRVLTALGGPSSVKLLLTGHSHFDHAFLIPRQRGHTRARFVHRKNRANLANVSVID